jgi:sRNA-binding regulator protein Hfq
LSLPGSVERRFPAPLRKAPVAKGHDAILKSMQDRGAIIEIFPVGYEGRIVGKMVNRDRYTITVELDGGQRRTVYKHAIESFAEVVSA